MTSGLCAADINLKVLTNAIAIAFRNEPAKRDAVLQLVADIRSDLNLRPFTSPHVTAFAEPVSAALPARPVTAESAASWPVEFETTKLLVTKIQESVWDIRASIKQARAAIDESRPLLDGASLELLSSVSLTTTLPDALPPTTTRTHRRLATYPQARH